MATKTAAPVDDTFDTINVTHKGRAYSFRELSAEEYDRCVALATKESGDLDTVQLLRWMIVEGSIEPKLDAGALGKLPFSAVTRISRAVNDLHFSPDDTDAEMPEKPELDEDGEEKRPNS